MLDIDYKSLRFKAPATRTLALFALVFSFLGVTLASYSVFFRPYPSHISTGLLTPNSISNFASPMTDIEALKRTLASQNDEILRLQSEMEQLHSSLDRNNNEAAAPQPAIAENSHIPSRDEWNSQRAEMAALSAQLSLLERNVSDLSNHFTEQAKALKSASRVIEAIREGNSFEKPLQMALSSLGNQPALFEAFYALTPFADHPPVTITQLQAQFQRIIPELKANANEHDSLNQADNAAPTDEISDSEPYSLFGYSFDFGSIKHHVADLFSHYVTIRKIKNAEPDSLDALLLDLEQALNAQDTNEISALIAQSAYDELFATTEGATAFLRNVKEYNALQTQIDRILALLTTPPAPADHADADANTSSQTLKPHSAIVPPPILSAPNTLKQIPLPSEDYAPDSSEDYDDGIIGDDTEPQTTDAL